MSLSTPRSTTRSSAAEIRSVKAPPAAATTASAAGSSIHTTGSRPAVVAAGATWRATEIAARASRWPPSRGPPQATAIAADATTIASRSTRLTIARPRSGVEAISRAADGDEVPGPIGVGLESLAQLADEVVDGACGARALAPDLGQQPGPAVDVRRVAGEEDQQLELEVGELDRLAVADDGALGEIDGDVAEA